VGLSCICAAIPLHAVDLGGIAIHGSWSSTAAYSPDYNYIGDTRDSLDLNQNELTLNGTRRFENGIKIAAQIYAYELAGYEDLTVDFANIDYSFRQEIGLRVGRNKLPGGLHNEVQYLDQVRIFASLPLNFYPRAARSFGASYDGAALYGNIPAAKAGNFDYQVYLGRTQPLDPEMPFMKGIGSSKLDVKTVYGAALVWNTPIAGLRAGYTIQRAPQMDGAMGPMIFDLNYTSSISSIEYTRGKWTATAEHKHATNEVEVVNFPAPTAKSVENHVYFQLAYQATEKLGLGAYYAYSDYENRGVDKDIALAAAYSLQPWWLVKAEVHLMDGITALGTSGDRNPGASDDTWTYFVLKTTLSF
jgi:hypothetical protein